MLGLWMITDYKFVVMTIVSDVLVNIRHSISLFQALVSVSQEEGSWILPLCRLGTASSGPEFKAPIYKFNVDTFCCAYRIAAIMDTQVEPYGTADTKQGLF